MLQTVLGRIVRWRLAFGIWHLALGGNHSQPVRAHRADVIGVHRVTAGLCLGDLIVAGCTLLAVDQQRRHLLLHGRFGRAALRSGPAGHGVGFSFRAGGSHIDDDGLAGQGRLARYHCGWRVHGVFAFQWQHGNRRCMPGLQARFSGQIQGCTAATAPYRATRSSPLSKCWSSPICRQFAALCLKHEVATALGDTSANARKVRFLKPRIPTAWLSPSLPAPLPARRRRYGLYRAGDLLKNTAGSTIARFKLADQFRCGPLTRPVAAAGRRVRMATNSLPTRTLLSLRWLDSHANFSNSQKHLNLLIAGPVE